MDQQTPTGGGRRLSDYQPPLDEVNKDEYQQFRQHLHTDKRTPKANHNPRAQEPESMFRFAGLQEPQPPSRIFPTPRQPDLEYYNGNGTSTSLPSHNDSPRSHRIAKRPASPSMTQQNINKRYQTHSNSPKVVTSLRSSHMETSGDFTTEMEVDTDPFKEESVVQGWDNIHAHQEEREPQSKQASQNKTRELELDIVEQMVPHAASRLVNGGSQNSQHHIPPQEPSSHQQLHFPLGSTPSQQPNNPNSRQHAVSQHYSSPRNHSSQERPPRMSHDPYSRANSQSHLSQAVRSQSVYLDYQNLPSGNMEDEDWVQVERGRQANRGTNYSLQSGHQTSTSSRIRHQSVAPEQSVDRSRSVIRSNGSSMTNSRNSFRDPRMARLDITARDLAFQRYSESRQTSAHRQQTPDSRRGTKQFIIDDLSGDESDIEIVVGQPLSVNNSLGKNIRQPTVEPQRPRRASTVGPEQLDYGNYHNLIKTPRIQRRQHRVEEDEPHQRPLGSPLWGPTRESQLPKDPAFQPISSNHPLQGYTPIHRYHNSPEINTSSSVQGRGGEAAHRTPSMQRVRSQSRLASVRRSPRAPSQPLVNSYLEAPQSRPRTPHTPHNRATCLDDVSGSDSNIASKSKQSIRSVRTPKTPRKKLIKDGDIIDDGLLLQEISMQEFFKPGQNKKLDSQPPQDRNIGIQRIHVPEGGIFRATKADSLRSQTVKPAIPVPKSRVTSGRGFKAPAEREVIDILTPKTSKPMKERIPPAAKKGIPKQITPTPRAKIPKPTPTSTKRTAKPKEEKIAPEVLRQQRAAEVIVSKELKGAEDALDEALFGEVVHDQAAEDRKAEEARAAGQRKRDEALAELLAKEEAARVAEAEKKKKLAEEAEKRKLEKEQEEEQKKIKREAERKKALALEKHEQELLRKKAEEQIRANREKAAEEERQKELEKQKAAKVQAEASLKLKAKQEEARKQAASLSAAKISSSDVWKSSKDDILMEDASSLFMPDIPAAVTSTAAPIITSTASATPPASDNAAEQPNFKATVPGSIAQVFAKASLPSSYRAEKDAEEARLAAERSEAARKKLDARWAAKALPSNPEARQSVLPLAALPLPAPRPEPAAEKHKPIKAPLVPKKALPPPKPKAKPELKPKASAKARVNNSLGSESSSSSGTRQESSNFLENLAAKPFFSGLPSNFSSFGRTKKKPTGPKPREYIHKVKLISELEREEIEKAEKEKKSTARKTRDRRKTEEQKAEAARKRTLAAREKKIQQIRDEAKKNGTEISEEELNKQVEEFMEKREKELEKRRIGYLRKEQGNDSPLSETPNSSQPFRPFQALVEDAGDEGLTPEEKLRKQNDRDYRTTLAAISAQRNNGFNQASHRKTVADFTDSEESEEDPDDEIIVSVPEQQSSDADDEDGSSNEDKDSDSESESESDDEEPMSPKPDMSASLKTLSEAAKTSARHSFNRSINEALNASSSSSSPSSAPSSRLVMLYQVMKKELIKATSKDEEETTNTQMVEQFLSLADANAFAKDIMNKFREYAHVSLSEWYKNGKFKGCIAHDETHESTIYIVALAKNSSDFPSAALAEMPKKFLEKSYVVMQYTDRRAKNAETGEFETHYREPKRLGYFSILQMANHEACKQLIETTKPPGARIDDLELHMQVAKQARESRDECDAEDREFDAEMECPPWMEGYSSLNIKVEKWEIEGPVN